MTHVQFFKQENGSRKIINAFKKLGFLEFNNHKRYNGYKYFSGFVYKETPSGVLVVYFSSSSMENTLLVRIAENDTDYTGGQNNFIINNKQTFMNNLGVLTKQLELFFASKNRKMEISRIAKLQKLPQVA